MIQIKTPCDANWQEMTPAESGKYCGACEKVVVDFSKMNDVQIKQYFTDYATQKTCGRFLDSQLERPLVVPSLTAYNKFINRLNQIPVARTILFFLTSASMWISSCVKNNDDTMITGDSIAVTESNTQLMHDTIATPEQRDNGLLIKQDPNEMVMGEIAPQLIEIYTLPTPTMGAVTICTPPEESDTVAVTIPASHPDTSDHTIHMIKGKVKMVDTISQKIQRKK